MRRRGPSSLKGQFEVFDDLVYDLVELSFFICPSLCDQKMEVRMKVNPASERLDHRNDAWSDMFMLWIAAVQVFFYYLLDNGTQVTKVSFKPVLIF